MSCEGVSCEGVGVGGVFGETGEGRERLLIQ